MWPDWAIFNFLTTNFISKSSPIFGVIWPVLKHSLFKVKNCFCFFWANFWEKLGYLLFQNLVTLQSQDSVISNYCLHKSLIRDAKATKWFTTRLYSGCKKCFEIYLIGSILPRWTFSTSSTSTPTTPPPQTGTTTNDNDRTILSDIKCT